MANWAASRSAAQESGGAQDDARRRFSGWCGGLRQAGDSFATVQKRKAGQGKELGGDGSESSDAEDAQARHAWLSTLEELRDGAARGSAERRAWQLGGTAMARCNDSYWWREEERQRSYCSVLYACMCVCVCMLWRWLEGEGRVEEKQNGFCHMVRY